jgi:rhomboid protease GluP
MCPNCRAFIDASDKVCQYCEAPVGPRAIDVRSPSDVLGGLIPHARFTTVMILLVNTALFIATVIVSMQKGKDGAIYDIDGYTLFDFGAKLGRFILAGQWWRLVTAGFLHGGLLHILMNSWVLFDLGAQVEELYGSARLLVFYFVATVFGFLASTLWNPNGLSVGASAGVFGLIGAMIALGVRSNTSMGSAIRGLYIRWAIYGLLFGLLPGLRVDNAAHIGGLVAGFAVAYLAQEQRDPMHPREKVWKVAAGICLALTAVSFFQMFLWLTRQAS